MTNLGNTASEYGGETSRTTGVDSKAHTGFLNTHSERSGHLRVKKGMQRLKPA